MEIGQVPAYKRWSNRYSHAFWHENLRETLVEALSE